MALTTCPDCANQYAADAPYCPNCGRPNPARQTGAAGATGSAPGAGTPETPAGTGSTSSTYTAGTGQAGSSGGTGSSAGTGNTFGGAAGGGFGGTGGTGTGGTGGYGGGGYGAAGGSPPQAIPNYLVHAILVTLCCCLPFGIVSIVYATQVNTKRDVGDIAGALEASNNAKKWAMIGAGAGVLAWLVWGLVYGFAMMAAIAGGGTTS
jgi:hypothetical protein